MPHTSPDSTPTSLWTRDYLLDLIVSHCIFASYTAMFTLIPLYVIERGGADWQLGIIVGSFGVVGLVVRPFAGQWVYSLGAKRIAFAGTAVFGVATLLHIFAFDVWLIVPARVLQGVGLALGPVATSTIVANLAPGHRRAEAMGYMGNSISAASLYAPAVGFWVLQRYGFESAFIFAAAFSFVGCVAAAGMSATRINLPVQPWVARRQGAAHQQARAVPDDGVRDLHHNHRAGLDVPAPARGGA